MIYNLLWRNGDRWGSGIVRTWDERVVDTTPALASLIGRPIARVLDTAERLGAQMTVEADGCNTRTVLRRMGEFGSTDW